MNALALFPLRATIHVLWADGAGMLRPLTSSIPCDDITRLRRFGPAKLMELFKALHLDRVILWADWAERPQDFRFFERNLGEHVVLVKVAGERGSPLPEGIGSATMYRERDARLAKLANPEDVETSNPFERTSARYWRTGNVGSVALPVDTSTEIVARCCGVGHTRASYRELEMVSAIERREGSTVLLDEQRTCTCCKGVVAVTSSRLVGGR